MPFAGTTPEIFWDRGRPARNAPQARSFKGFQFQIRFSRFALIAGGTPAVPANHLSRSALLRGVAGDRVIR
jgi:hypothetical protein